MRMRIGAMTAGLVYGVVVAVSGLSAQRPATEELVWPLPPEPPRIQFAGMLSSDRDLGKETSFLGRLRSVVTGERPDVTAVVRPHDVHVDGAGRMYVTNGLQPGFYVFDPGAHEARFVQTEGMAGLTKPMGLTGDAEGNLYIADATARRVVVLDQAGVFIRAYGGETVLLNPVDVALSPSGDRVYVVDSYLHQVVVFDRDGTLRSRIGRNQGDLAAKRAAKAMARHPDPGVESESVHGEDPSDLVENRGLEAAEFRYPGFVATAPDGTVYVTDQMNFRVQAFDRDGVYLREFGRMGDGSGAFARPKGVAVDSEGHVYVADAAFNNIQVFDAQGRLLLAFGEMGRGEGRLWLPTGMAIDPRDRIFVADRYNNRLQIYQYLGGEPQLAERETDNGSRR